MVLSSNKIKELAQKTPRQVADVLSGRVKLDDSVPEELRALINRLKSQVPKERQDFLAAEGVGEILHVAVLRQAMERGLNPDDADSLKSVADKVTIPVTIAREDDDAVDVDGDDIVQAIAEMLAKTGFSGDGARPSRRIRRLASKKRRAGSQD